jgi:hypothetical protein
MLACSGRAWSYRRLPPGVMAYARSPGLVMIPKACPSQKERYSSIICPAFPGIVGSEKVPCSLPTDSNTSSFRGLCPSSEVRGRGPVRCSPSYPFLPGSCFFAAPALACSYCFRFCVFPILLSRCSSSGISGLVRVLGIVPVPIPVPRRNEMRRIYCGFWGGRSCPARGFFLTD